MKLIVSGSRKVNDFELVRKTIEELKNQGLEITAIIEGAARGVDSLASRYAVENGIENIRVPADWKQYHKAAGVIRNKKMAEMGEVLLAFWDGSSKGTMNMIKFANKKGIPVHIVYL